MNDDCLLHKTEENFMVNRNDNEKIKLYLMESDLARKWGSAY